VSYENKISRFPPSPVVVDHFSKNCRTLFGNFFFLRNCLRHFRPELSVTERIVSYLYIISEIIFLLHIQAERGFAAGAVLFDLGGNGAFWKKEGVKLHRLRISDKQEILCKLTVFDNGGNLNCCLLLSRHLVSIRGPSLLIIELWKDDPLRYMTVAIACTIAHL
jgi:hypothetical protein